MPRKISPERLPDLLRPGMTVFVQGASGQPTPLLQALAEAPEASDGVHYVGCFIPGFNVIDPASFHASARLTSFFVFGAIARSHAAGKVRFLPLHYSGIWDYLAGLEIDLALIQVTPPDRSGRCSLGVSVHFVPAVLDRAKVIVAEINAAMPRPAHSYEIPYDRLDHVVETERPLVAVPTGGLPPETHRIGTHVAGLIDDGDTIQIGIGKVPAAVLASLRDRRDLGLHGGLVSDEVANLHEAGVLTGARKSRDAGTMVCTAALGGPRVYDWAGRCPELRFAPVSYTHDLRVLAQLEHFVAINSVLAVDLSGQANAEMLERPPGERHRWPARFRARRPPVQRRPVDPGAALDCRRRQELAHRAAPWCGRRGQLPARGCGHRGHRARRSLPARQVHRRARRGADRDRRSGVSPRPRRRMGNASAQGRRRLTQRIVLVAPPSMKTSAPWICSATGEARNATRLAMSSGWL